MVGEVKRRGALVVAAGLVLAACRGGTSPRNVAPPPPEPTTAVVTSPTVLTADVAGFGTLLVDRNGRTLYSFDGDANGVLGCQGSCLTTWPPFLLADPSTIPVGVGIGGALGLVARPDGTYQLTFNTRPLYYFSGDQQRGDTRGDGAGDAWHVVKAGLEAASAGTTTVPPGG